MMTDPNIDYVIASYAIAGAVLVVVAGVYIAHMRKAVKILKKITNSTPPSP